MRLRMGTFAAAITVAVRGRRGAAVLLAGTAALAALAMLWAAAGASSSAEKRVRTKVVYVCDDFFVKPKVCDAAHQAGTVKIHKGDKVKWKWLPNVSAHNVWLTKAPDGVRKSKFRSGLPVGSDDTPPFPRFIATFKKRGRYHFICRVHQPDMKMNVRVRR
jgi:plastocyanin